MWEKLNKISVQVIISVIVIVSSYGLLYLLSFKEVPAGNRDLFNVTLGAVIGSSLTAVIGWLFTSSKHNSRENSGSNKPNTP